MAMVMNEEITRTPCRCQDRVSSAESTCDPIDPITMTVRGLRVRVNARSSASRAASRSSCAKALRAEGHDDEPDTPPDVLRRVQAEAAATWRSPADARQAARGAERLRAWCEGFSLHAGVVIAQSAADPATNSRCKGSPQLRAVYIDEARHRLLMQISYLVGAHECIGGASYVLWELPR
jgi:hypothetical protein